MGRGSKQKKPSGKKSAKVQAKDDFFREDIDDEIDAFHKQRDVVPLDLDADSAGSDDEMEHSVFNLEGGDDDSENSKSDDGDDEIDNEEVPLKGFAAKIAKQAKYLKQKFGGVDETIDDDTDDEEKEKVPWGSKKNRYYDADNVATEPQSSDEEILKEEENEVVKIQRERAQSLAMADFGLEDDVEVDSDSDGHEKAFKDAFAGTKAVAKHNVDALLADDPFESYEEMKKDITALSKEEQMEVVYSSAPELVGLLTELDKALNQLKQVKPLLSKVEKEDKDMTKGSMNYLEVKRIMLLTYCQAIGFYLLLKAEGNSVRDHPVIARLVEIKNLLEKMEQINLDLPFQSDEITNIKTDASRLLPQESVPMDHEQKTIDASTRQSEIEHVDETPQLVKDSSSKGAASKNRSKNLQVGLQSKEMLKVRANLEAKLKEKGRYIYSNLKPETTQNHALVPANHRLETLDDFDDEVQLTAKGHSRPSTVPSVKGKKPKFISGDEDLPKRDDVGERRRKFEEQLHVRASFGDSDGDVKKKKGGANMTFFADATALENAGEALELEDEFYKQVKKQRTDKVLAKEQLYSRTPTVPNPSPLQIGEDDKRQITYQMEKNRGLTRNRKKLTKNPRKKYKIKHQKAVIRRKGQVRDIKKPTGPYGGETSGINVHVSRSIRFKS